MSVTGWTDERVEALRRLWGEGLSASQIAKQLGDVSRNAVIGKVHRLGLEGRVKGTEGAEGGEGTTADMGPSEGRDTPRGRRRTAGRGRRGGRRRPGPGGRGGGNRGTRRCQ